VGQLVFRFVDAGAFHACGLTVTDQLLCWGYNADGQLGTAAGPPALYPTLIPGEVRYRLVSGGRYHGCGLDFAFEVTCWGENRDLRAGPPAPPSFREVDAGLVHSCALTLDDEIYCWGWNDEGELGVSDPGATSSDLDGGWDAVSAGGLHTCAIRETGAAECWGFNEEGQVGNGGSGTVMTPTVVSGGFTFLTDPLVVPPQPDPDFPLPDGPFIAAGYSHTCALTTTGVARCWGLNQDGQLGDGTLTLRRTPVMVGGGLLVFSRITAGLAHSCALTSAGAAYCWGDNTWGQLGEGTTTDATGPVAVSGDLIFTYLKAGDNSTCGVTTTGVAYCWGDNHYGQLGTGTNDASLVPVKVALQP
jgi:alpha-tubulin suppressor-like RCC1 family protein